MTNNIQIGKHKIKTKNKELFLKCYENILLKELSIDETVFESMKLYSELYKNSLREKKLKRIINYDE